MPKARPLPPVETLWDLFSYDPLRGELFWKESGPGRRTGTPAGTLDNQGYRGVGVLGQRCLMHRLVWKWVHGTEPGTILDHVGQEGAPVKFNHVWGLEEVAQGENKRRSGDGVFWYKPTSKWLARRKIDGK